MTVIELRLADIAKREEEISENNKKREENINSIIMDYKLVNLLPIWGSDKYKNKCYFCDRISNELMWRMQFNKGQDTITITSHGSCIPEKDLSCIDDYVTY